MNKYQLVVLFAVLFLADRIVKLFFKEILLINTKGFYGLVPGSNLIFIIISVIIIPLLFAVILKSKKTLTKPGVALVLTGIVANLTDRILFGGVLDIKIKILNFSNALNLADIYIVTGIIILIMSTCFLITPAFRMESTSSIQKSSTNQTTPFKVWWCIDFLISAMNQHD